MDFLARDSVSFSDEFWSRMDQTVVTTLSKHLIARKFMPLFGPLGAGVLSIQVDDLTTEEEDKQGIVKMSGRNFVEITQLFEDFVLYWRDIENSEAMGFPYDLSKAILAAQAMANKEDKLIFFGNDYIGSEGLLTASGVQRLERSDWSIGEGAFLDIAQGISIFTSKGLLGNYALIVTPDLFAQLHRIQPTLGMMEIDRISKMLHGRVFNASVLGKNKAILVCAEPQFMDLAVGKDLETGYLETKDFNHVFRMIDTVALRLKCKDAVIVYED